MKKSGICMWAYLQDLFSQLGCIRCHHCKVNRGWPPWLPLASCSKDCATLGVVAQQSKVLGFLVVFLQSPVSKKEFLFFLLPLLSSCSHGQKHCGVCSRNRWSDTLWCHAVLCQATLLISFHFLRVSEPMFS